MVATAPTTHKAREHFATTMQSALTLQEVEQAFLDAAGGVIPVGVFGLYQIHSVSGHMVKVRSSTEVEFLDDYEEYGRSDDPVLEFALSQRRPIDSSRAVPPNVWERSGARAAIDLDGYYHSLEAPVLISGVLYGTINFARRRNDPAFSSADLASARVVGEQLGLATERALRYERTGQRTTMLEHVLDRLPQAVVVTDLDGRVLFRNRAAYADGVGQMRGGARSPAEENILEAVGDLRQLGKRVVTRAVNDPHTQRRLVSKSYRLPDRDDAAMTITYECDAGGSSHLPTWDALTRREQEIAALVSQGLTNKQIAQQAHLSENTVKSHLKRVFNKTDVRNRAELLQRIWSTSSREPGNGDTRHNA